MPAKSCQCPERRAPIASRRWEVCSKPGDGTTVVRCKACGAAGMCPNYTSTPDWWKLRRLSDKWVTGLMEMCPGCDEEGDKIYEELMA